MKFYVRNEYIYMTMYTCNKMHSGGEKLEGCIKKKSSSVVAVRLRMPYFP
jgi:hypothetical protein